MLLRHWMKAGLVFLYLAAIVWILHQCSRLFEPAPRPIPVRTPELVPAPRMGEPPVKPESKTSISARARDRAEKRHAHEADLMRRRAAYLALEADLPLMLQNDIPAALDELAKVATQYRHKRSDLKYLSKAEQWEREIPIKDALARARDLTTDFFATDREAQKGREGPTTVLPSQINALTKRLEAFKRGDEEITSFAAALPALYGKVPERLMLSAIDAMARTVLPADAFDPCRDPKASTCPKPTPVEIDPVATSSPPIPTLPKKQSRPIYCVDRFRLREYDRLPLRADPSPYARAITYIAPGRCVTATGRIVPHRQPAGLFDYYEVVDDMSNIGWVNSAFVMRR